MPANYQHLNLQSAADAIKAFWVHSPFFGFHWHYHPELEITCVKRGRGTRMVGDNVSPFSEGDFVFLGSNLPHTWISDDDFKSSEEQMEVAVLQFHPSVLDNLLLSLPEMVSIRRLLDIAHRGVVLSEQCRERASQLLYSMIDAEGIRRITLFLEFVEHLHG